MLATPYAQSLDSPGSHQRCQLHGNVRYVPKTKVGPTVAVYNLTMGSRTSSRYQTAVTEFRLNMCRSVRYPNEIPAHTIMLPPRNP
ncbi:hypothetical protein TNIN_414451 [Trichonephila inaurata madagascariensis]|uniref:Uncharacterized protein n=1 Tax=Trichonephila inaurata madagascariensis TaxID=2747483 RepID=A0A8X6XXR5_9ARAC|nr:hypothetical protein TNIN_414451 [Trichonephila inaurata madagascariensis]